MIKVEKVIGEAIAKYEDFSIVKIYEKLTGSKWLGICRTNEGIKDLCREHKGEERLITYGVLYKDKLVEKGKKILVFKNYYGYQFGGTIEELTVDLIKKLEDEYHGKFIKAYDIKTESELYNHLERFENGELKDFLQTKSGREELEELKLQLNKLNEEGKE